MLLYFLALRLFADKRIAAFAALVYAFYPTFFFYSAVLATEHLLVLLLLGALLVILAEGRSPIWQSALAGLLLGAAMLTRGDALFYIPCILALFSYRLTTMRKVSLPRALGPIAVMLFTILVVVFPWYWRNRIQIGPGSGLSTTGGVNFYCSHNDRAVKGCDVAGEPILEQADELTCHREGFRLGMQFILGHPLASLIAIGERTRELYMKPNYGTLYSVAQSEGQRTKRQLSERLESWGWYLLCLLVLLGPLAHRYWSRQSFLLLFSVVASNWVCYAVVFWGKPRYRFVPDVLFCLIAGATLAFLTSKVKELRAAKKATCPCQDPPLAF